MIILTQTLSQSLIDTDRVKWKCVPGHLYKKSEIQKLKVSYENTELCQIGLSI